MPTYVYKCDSCGAQFEQFQSFKDEPIRTCPSCASAVRRVFQPVGIVFKGSGWYVTDSRKSTSAATTSDEKTDTTETKTDSTKAEPAKTEAASTGETAKSEPAKPASTSTSTANTSGNSSATA